MRNFCNLSDSTLIYLFRQGDTEALSELINRHKERIFTSIVFLVQDPVLAEDIFQDTFIKIIKMIRRGRYTEEGKFLPWAVRIAHNLSIDHFRRRKKMAIVNGSEDFDLLELIPLQDNNVEEDLMVQESHSRVVQMLDYLSKEQKEVIVLRIFGSLSFKEIAEQTDVSINTALGRMRYGLINLRKLMMEKQISL